MWLCSKTLGPSYLVHPLELHDLHQAPLDPLSHKCQLVELHVLQPQLNLLLSLEHIQSWQTLRSLAN